MRYLWLIFAPLALIPAGCSRPQPDSQLVERVRLLESENARLRAAVASAKTPPPATAAPESPTFSREKAALRAVPAKRPDQRSCEAAASELRSLELDAAACREASVNLERRLQETLAHLEAASRDSRRLEASQAELRDKLADANRRLDTLAEELKSRQASLAQLEAANLRLRQAAPPAGQSPLSSELEDISRRRQQFIESILRRYRELTDHYRMLAGAVDRSHDRNAVPAANTAEVSRIQSVLSSAEEEVRQLNSLTAREQLIRKRMLAQAPAAKIP
ncbi:MAG TPA: hypothetical protein VMZ52_09390 [Bryobacteraceae bacterium]|nr:hypothetical protein [Bryobacteraceae bacterium]